MKKVLNGIKNIIIGIIGFIFFGFVIVITVLLLNYNDYGVTKIENTSLIIIRDDISSNNYNKGDLVLVETKKLDRINIGDEIFVYKIDANGNVSIDLGKVGKTHPDDEVISFENGDTYSMEFVIGKASKTYEKIGTYLAIIESKWGFLFMILVPSFLIFIYEFYALIVEVKYGKEEAQNIQKTIN